MRRLAAFCIVIILLIILVGFSQTAIDPEDFSGEWYSSDNQNVYLFREGLIYCPKFPIALTDSIFISGAYSHCDDSIVLFAAGIPGLETEKELYLIEKEDASFLYENKDGSGTIYFIRYHD